jgi:hypothetical protein
VAVLPGIFVRNWPLKLAALTLSVILWVLVASEETTSQLVEVRVEIELPDDLALARPAPVLRALVTGPGRELIRLYTNPLTIHALVPPSAQPPHWRLVVAPSDVLLSRNLRVSVQDVEPRSLDFDIDHLVHREVPVALRGVIEAESGFAVTRPLQVTPATVRVSGARALVTLVDSIPTEAVDVRGVTGPFERKVPIDTAGHPLLRIAPHDVVISGRTRRS